ncbi:MAG TPA: ABC transporter substrate-binding protein [Candidatus Limnocylindria bacterium]|nr:ABC transporter substrate-binding protein [Candidatus Limnocylindria bacterium]
MAHGLIPWSRRFVAVALTGMLVAACSQTPSAPGESSPPAAGSQAASSAPAEGEPKLGGELRFQLLRDADAGYDPALATLSTVYTINGLIFDTLGEVQPDGSIEPSLAESWDISDDELTYTFQIREGVVFHNGREMTAEDIKYTIDRVMDPATNSPRQSVFTSVESVEAPDATTLIIQLSEPFAPLLASLSDISMGIVPQEEVEERGTLDEFPIGTGPFKFVEWVRDDHLTVEANEDYWREGLPYLDGVVFSFNDDANARAANVRSGTIDFLWNSPPELWQVLNDDENLQVFGGEGTQSFQYFLLNMQKPPFDDVRVRQAIYWALDREAIRQISRPDTTTPLNAGFLPASHWAGLPEDEIVYTQDYDRAASLLEEAGYGDGFEMEIIALIGSDFHIRTAQAIQSQLEPLGITVTVTTVDSGQQNEARDSGTFDGMVTGFSGTIDPDARFTQTFATGGGTNYVDFSDPEVDDLIEQARQTSDRDERADLYRQAQLRIAEVGPMAFIYNYHFFDTLQSYVKGYVYNPQLVDYRSVRQVWLDQ